MPRMQRRDQRFWSRVEANPGKADRGCFGKAHHSCKRKAQAEARRLEAEKPGELFRSYKCKLCGSWHNGHDRTGSL